MCMCLFVNVSSVNFLLLKILTPHPQGEWDSGEMCGSGSLSVAASSFIGTKRDRISSDVFLIQLLRVVEECAAERQREGILSRWECIRWNVA